MQKLCDKGESNLEKDSEINSSSRIEEYCEADFTEVLNKYRVELVKKIDFNRQLILAHLQSKGVLDEEDCENIRGSATSRQQQVSCFLNILARKGRNSYHVFLEALELEDGELFELLTGKKTSKRFNLDRCAIIKPFSVLTDQQFVDHERQYLASELEKSICSNQKMSHLQSILLKEKSLLQEENENLKHVIAEKDVALEDIEREYRTLQDMSRTKIENNDSLQLHLLKTQQLCKDNAEKSQMIIQYQHQIIMLKDDQDLLHKEITSLKLKNSNLLKKMNDLKTDYDWQRSCSQRLSEQVDQSKDELKQLRKEKEARKKIFDLQFELAQVNEEKDDALHKMKEYREVTSALKVKYDKLKQEKNEEAERRGEESQILIKLKNDICQLQHDLKLQLNRNDILERKKERLQQEIATHKEQRSFYLTERETILCERDQLAQSFEEIRKYNSELQQSRDEAVNKQLEMSKLLDKTREEFEERVHELNGTIMELEKELQEKVDFAMNEPLFTKEGCVEPAVAFNVPPEQEVFGKRDTSNREEAPVKSFNRIKRCDTDIIKSIRKRLSADLETQDMEINNKCYQTLDSQQMGLTFSSLSEKNSPLAEIYSNPRLLLQEKLNKHEDAFQDSKEKTSTTKMKSASMPVIKNYDGRYSVDTKNQYCRQSSALNAVVPNTFRVTSTVLNKYQDKIMDKLEKREVQDDQTTSASENYVKMTKKGKHSLIKQFAMRDSKVNGSRLGKKGLTLPPAPTTSTRVLDFFRRDGQKNESQTLLEGSKRRNRTSSAPDIYRI